MRGPRPVPSAAALAGAFVLAVTPVACDRSPDATSGVSSPTSDGSSIWFRDVTDEAGITFGHVRAPEIRHHFPEIMGGGAALFDFDDDGFLDLYLVQSGDVTAGMADPPGNRLYRNQGDGTFLDVTETAGVGDTGYGIGCCVGDYDGDGDVDLYVSNVGPNVLYRNEGGGRFTDVTVEAGVGDPAWSTSCAFLDHDNDGDLDLFVVNYLNWSVEGELECRAGSGDRDYCKPNNYNSPMPDTLFRNDGGTFVDASESAGLRAAFGNGLGIACADFDADGLVDVYVANDGMPNQLWMNQGSGRFSDEALVAGCAVNMQGVAEAGMGVAAVDLENDGDDDLFMTHLRDESNTFYVNRGGLFEDTTPMTGLSTPSIQFTGFGMGFADFDLDGERDLFIANGRVGKWGPPLDGQHPYAEPNQVFKGLGGGRFEELLPRGACDGCPMGTSRAAAFGDVDNDGGVDVVVVDSGGPARLLRNTAATGTWIMLRVLDADGTDAVGAVVEIEAGERVQRRTVRSAYSYCAANDLRVHVGLGGATRVDDVRVVWPDGRRQSFGSLEPGTVHVLRADGR